MGKFAAIRWQTFWIWTAKWFEIVSLIIAGTAQLYQSKRIRRAENGRCFDLEIRGMGRACGRTFKTGTGRMIKEAGMFYKMELEREK